MVMQRVPGSDGASQGVSQLSGSGETMFKDKIIRAMTPMVASGGPSNNVTLRKKVQANFRAFLWRAVFCEKPKQKGTHAPFAPAAFAGQSGRHLGRRRRFGAPRSLQLVGGKSSSGSEDDDRCDVGGRLGRWGLEVMRST